LSALLADFFVLRLAFVSVLRSAADPQIHGSSLTTLASYIIGGIASYWLIDLVPGSWT